MNSIHKYILCLLVISAPFFFGFAPSSTKPHTAPSSNSTLKDDSLLTSNFNRQWQININSGNQGLDHLYTENAVKVQLGGAVLEGQAKILEYYKTKAYQIDSIVTVHSISAVLDSTTIYEIGRFWTSEKKGYAHLILWREKNGKLLRELEFMAPLESTENFSAQIDKKRTEWMALCNAHNTKGLVTKFYSENALYYNHRPMIIGQEAIIEEYSYMNDPNYKLTLNPTIFERVNTSIAFEIGQCSGSYPGNYVLVWQKGKDGDWRIFFDSNI
ncbi:MAG: YybH family protein [Aurantibacter sp.]